MFVVVCFCNNTDSFTLDKGDFLNIRCICAASNDGTVAKVGMDKREIEGS